MSSGLGRRVGLLVLGLGLAACAGSGLRLASGEPAASSREGIRIAFEDVAAPDVLRIEGEAAVAGEEAGAGIWAAVPDLPRPERALVRSSQTGRTVLAALFGGEDRRPLLSHDAARALGIGANRTAPVTIVAVRSEVVVVPPTGF